MSEAKRQRWIRWKDRLRIIALGLTLGLAARWIISLWPAPAVPAPAAAVNASK